MTFVLNMQLTWSLVVDIVLFFIFNYLINIKIQEKGEKVFS